MTGRHVGAFSARHIKTGEKIVATGFGYIGDAMGRGERAQHSGVLIVTDSRAVFYRKGFFGEIVESIPLKSIGSIERRSMLGHRTLRLHTSHDALEFKTFEADAERALAEAIDAGRAAN